MPCNGNGAQTCGGRSRLNLFVADELLSLEPCGYEPPVSSSSTTLPPSSTATPTSSSETTAPPVTTTTSTTTEDTPTTTTSSSACVSTTVVPPTCEYKCGKWCSSPLPDWDDVKSCKAAWSSCVLQVASCFKHAGWPHALECFDFGGWCGDVAKYCDSKPTRGCKKSDFWSKKPPKGHNPPRTITVTTTCAPTATSTSTTKAPIPTPTNICKQPSSLLYGYGPGRPVGGIEMPVVTCNDVAEDWPQWPFKQYNEADSRRCKKYARGGCAAACAEACKEQLDDCVAVYAEACKQRGFSWRWHDSHPLAVIKCKAQYTDCLRENRGVTCKGKCLSYGGW